MDTVSSLADLPSVPAVFALYGGAGSRTYVAYVGIADQLKRRVTQHLVRRDSVVTTGTSATGLHPDYVTALRWWTHPGFAQRPFLEAAGLVATKVLDPSLRTHGTVVDAVRRIHYRPKFRREMTALFRGAPAGALQIPTLADALDQIRHLETRIAALERASAIARTR